MKMISELSILLENLPLTFKFWLIIQYAHVNHFKNDK